MKISEHARERMRDRLGLNNTAIDRLATKAFEQGIKHRDVKGRRRRFVDGLFLSERQANNIRIYGEFVYLFCNDTLVTVFHLPKHLK